MQFDVQQLAPPDAYKLLTNIVVPRPIAWVTSRDANGVINLAPFSFFNAVGSNPPLVIVSVGNAAPNDPKDTARNIEATREFVVNFVTEELIGAMNISAADFPRGESELTAAGLSAAPSMKLKTPRVAESKASLECQLHSIQTIGANHLILATIVAMHLADEFITDPKRYHVNGFAPIGRLGSPSMYCRTADRFDLPRLSYADVKREREL